MKMNRKSVSPEESEKQRSTKGRKRRKEITNKKIIAYQS
jgi:hypothetical protein